MVALTRTHGSGEGKIMAPPSKGVPPSGRASTSQAMRNLATDVFYTGAKKVAESSGITPGQADAQIREGATVGRQQDYDVGSFSRQIKELGTSLESLNKSFINASKGLNATTQENITMMKIAMRNSGNDKNAIGNAAAATQSTLSTAYYGGMNRGQAMQNIDALSQAGVLGAGSRATGGTAMSIQAYNTSFTAASAASGGFGTRADQYGMTATAMLSGMAQRGAQGISGSQVTSTLGAVNLAAQQTNNAMLHNVAPGAYVQAEQSMMAGASQSNPMLMAAFSKARPEITRRNEEGLQKSENEATKITEQLKTAPESQKAELTRQLTAKQDEAKTFRTRLDTISSARGAGAMGVQAVMEMGDTEAHGEMIQNMMRQRMGKSGDILGNNRRALIARTQVAQATGMTTQQVSGILQTQARMPEIKARQAEADAYMSTEYTDIGKTYKSGGKTVTRTEAAANQIQEAFQGTFRSGTFEDFRKSAANTVEQTGQSSKFKEALKKDLDAIGATSGLDDKGKLDAARAATKKAINEGSGGDVFQASSTGVAANKLQEGQAGAVELDNAFKSAGKSMNDMSKAAIQYAEEMSKAAGMVPKGDRSTGTTQSTAASSTGAAVDAVVAGGKTVVAAGGAAATTASAAADYFLTPSPGSGGSSSANKGGTGKPLAPPPRTSEFGGPVFRGLSGTVGERGPEIFTPKQDGFITTNKDSSSISDMFKSSLGAINQAFTGGLSKSMKDKPPSTPIPADASADGSTAPVGGGDDGKDFLGKVAATFESGGDPGRVSTGEGDAGGKSFGAFQLSSKTGSLEAFLKQTGYIKNFEGMNLKSPGKDVEAQWKKLAENPDFVKAQSGYAKEKYYDPHLAMLKKSGVDLSGKGRAVDEMILSTANQYGAGSSVLLNAFKGKNVAQMSAEEIINTAQQYKAGSTGTYFSSSSEAVRAGVRNRIAKEQQMLLGMTKRAEGGDIVRGEPTLVGEKGPEMFVPNSGGSVSSASQTKKLLEANQDSGNGGSNKEISGKIIVEFVSEGQKVGESELSFNGPDQRISINPRRTKR